MTAPLLTTKLYIPPPRPNAVLRPRLLARLDAGLQGKLTLISAPAGFGKTTLASTWVSMCQRPVAWLALDAGDNDPLCFLTYVTAAMQRIAPGLGQGVMRGLRSPQPLPIAALQTALVNEFVTLTEPAILVLDDYHVLESADVGAVLAFLLDHLPPPLHLVIATREDPPLPLARLRARGQLHEVRGTDLRFTRDEAAAFLEHCMGLKLTAEHLAALEERTEGWIAGLQLAAISMQGSPQDTDSFIQAFTGSHRFVMDYLVEEVLQQQPAAVQTFLLRTAILERLCGPLCDAVVGAGATTGQETLAWLERANLFLVPLDDERRWYRYHHLFGDLLRQRLLQSDPDAMNALHIRASQWFEANNLELEAFHHAVAAHDTDRAARLAAGRGMPLLFRGAIAPVLNWLAALPHAALDLRPALWVMYASALLFVSRIAGIEEKLQAAEAALQHVELDARSRDLIGHIALIRATVAVSQHQAETIVAQARRALEYLHPENLPVRTAATWALGYAHQLRKERGAARQAYTAAIAASQSIGHFIITLMATIGLGAVQESDTELDTAAETYRRAIDLAGDPPQPTVCDAHLGLARIAYARNELDAAATHAQRSLHLAQQIEKTDRFISSQVFLARLKLVQGDAAGSIALLAQAEQAVHQHNFVLRSAEVAEMQVLALLHQSNRIAAAQVARTHALPVSQARVQLAQGDAAAALVLLAPARESAEAKGWAEERLQAIVLQAIAHAADGDADTAQRRLGEALALAAPSGFIRLFVDEGEPMAHLLAAARGLMPAYVDRLRAAFGDEDALHQTAASVRLLVEPLSARELEVLTLIAAGLSNQAIAARLFLALDTVKGHNRRIFEKLQVQRRTEAVAKARALRLLPDHR